MRLVAVAFVLAASCGSKPPAPVPTPPPAPKPAPAPEPPPPTTLDGAALNLGFEAGDAMIFVEKTTRARPNPPVKDESPK